MKSDNTLKILALLILLVPTLLAISAAAEENSIPTKVGISINNTSLNLSDHLSSNFTESAVNLSNLTIMLSNNSTSNISNAKITIAKDAVDANKIGRRTISSMNSLDATQANQSANNTTNATYLAIIDNKLYLIEGDILRLFNADFKYKDRVSLIDLDPDNQNFTLEQLFNISRQLDNITGFNLIVQNSSINGILDLYINLDNPGTFTSTDDMTDNVIATSSDSLLNGAYALIDDNNTIEQILGFTDNLSRKNITIDEIISKLNVSANSSVNSTSILSIIALDIANLDDKTLERLYNGTLNLDDLKNMLNHTFSETNKSDLGKSNGKNITDEDLVVGFYSEVLDNVNVSIKFTFSDLKIVDGYLGQTIIVYQSLILESNNNMTEMNDDNISALSSEAYETSKSYNFNLIQELQRYNHSTINWANGLESFEILDHGNLLSLNNNTSVNLAPGKTVELDVVYRFYPVESKKVCVSTTIADLILPDDNIIMMEGQSMRLPAIKECNLSFIGDTLRALDLHINLADYGIIEDDFNYPSVSQDSNGNTLNIIDGKVLVGSQEETKLDLMVVINYSTVQIIDRYHDSIIPGSPVLWTVEYDVSRNKQSRIEKSSYLTAPVYLHEDLYNEYLGEWNKTISLSTSFDPGYQNFVVNVSIPKSGYVRAIEEVPFTVFKTNDSEIISLLIPALKDYVSITIIGDLEYSSKSLANNTISDNQTNTSYYNDSELASEDIWINNTSPPKGYITSEQNNSSPSEMAYAEKPILMNEIVVGKPVRWRVKLNSSSYRQNSSNRIIDIALPENASQISLNALRGSSDLEIKSDIKRIRSSVQAKGSKSQARNLAMNKKSVIAQATEIDSQPTTSMSNAEKDTIPPISEMQDEYTITLNDSLKVQEADSFEIEFTTPGPTVSEEFKDDSESTVIIESDYHYNNVTTYARLPSEVSSSDQINLIWMRNDSALSGSGIEPTAQQINEFELEDQDFNGLFDTLKWITPHLSSQTFIIIIVTDAKQLDSDRNILEDIYQYVSIEDDIYKLIQPGQFVRVKFERNLSYQNDITIIATSQGQSSLEIYEKNSNETLAIIPSISDVNKYRALLTSLGNRLQDTFDIKVIGDAVAFDYITDPITSLTSSYPANNSVLGTDRPIFNFTAISNTSANFSCSLYINDVLNQTNSTVFNNTLTVINTSIALSDGTYSWYMNCSDTTDMISETRIVTVDTSSPQVTALLPQNNSANSSINVEFSCNATDTLSLNHIALNITGIAGSVDLGFNNATGLNGIVYAIANHTNGSIIIGGAFTTIEGVTANRIARLHANGTMDTSFNSGSGANNIVYAIRVQPDGNIMIGGQFTTINGVTRNRVARLLANGSLDTSFNPVSAANNIVQTISLLSDGRILIGGSFTTYNGIGMNRTALLLADGSLDTNFVIGYGANNIVYASVVDENDRIILGGQFTTFDLITANRVMAIFPNGTQDGRFNNASFGTNNIVWELARQSDGKIILGGQFTTVNGTARARIARLLSNGTHDLTFTPGAGANGIVYAVAVDILDRILIGGAFTTYNGQARNFTQRLTKDGVNDTIFNISYGPSATVRAIKLDKEQKILLGGLFTSYNTTARYYLARVNSDYLIKREASTSINASWNVSFGNGYYNWTCQATDQASNTIFGVNSTIHIDRISPVSAAMAVTSSGGNYNFGDVSSLSYVNVSLSCSDSNGVGCNTTIYCTDISDTCTPAIIYSGNITVNTSGTSYIRYHSNDTLGNTESVNSRTIILGSLVFVPNSDSSGTHYGRNYILANASAGNDNLINITLFLYNSLAILINSTADAIAPFAANWTAIPDGQYFFNSTAYYADGSNLTSETRNVTLDSTPPIVLALQPGINTSNSSSIITFMCNASDSTLLEHLALNISGIGGSVDLGFTPGIGPSTTVLAVANHTNNSILIAGSFITVNGVSRNRIARLFANGSLDTNFDPGTGANNIINALVVLPNNSILIGGTFTTFRGTSRNRVARILDNGSLDNAFIPGVGPDNAVNALGLLSDGRIVIGGAFTVYNGTPMNRTAVLLENGTIDQSFNIGAGFDNQVYSLIVEPNNRIILGGQFTLLNLGLANRLAALYPNGTIDHSFIAATGGTDNIVYTMSRQSDGKIIIGGAFTLLNSVATNRVARLFSNGTRDTSFNIGTGANAIIYSSKIDALGRVLVGGDLTLYNGIARNYTARLLSNGSLDITYNISLGASNSVRAIGFDTSQNIILGGLFTTFNLYSRNYITKLNTDYLVFQNSSMTIINSWNISLDNGLYTWSCRAADYINNENSTPISTLLIDRIAPITTPIGTTAGGAPYTFGQPTASLYVNVTFSCSDTSGVGCNATYYCNDTVNTCDPIELYLSTIQITANGSSFVRFRSNDSLNNLENIESVEILKQGISFVYPSDSSGILINRDYLLVNISAGSDNLLNITIEVYNSSHQLVNSSSSPTSPAYANLSNLGQGNYYFNATAYYSDMNNLSTTTRNVTVDTIPPIVELVFPSNNTFNSSATTQFSCNATDINGISSLSLSIPSIIGSVDLGFDIGTGCNNIVYSGALEQDGSILIGGSFTAVNGVTRNRMARLYQNGSLDPQFGGGNGANNIIYAVRIQSDGKILIGGDFTTINGSSRNRTARLNQNGSVDLSFNPEIGASSSVLAILVNESDIYLGGLFTSFNGTAIPYLVKTDSSGTLNLSFDAQVSSNVRALANDHNGSIVLGGDFISVGGVSMNRIARILENGTLDTMFAPGVAANNIIYTIGIDSLNRILIGGAFTSVSGIAQNRIARYHENGTLDRTFNPGTGANGNVLKLIVEANDNVVLGGSFTTLNGSTRNFIGRVTSTGLLDQSFYPISGAGAAIQTMFIDNYGRIVVGGSFLTIGGASKNYVARLNSDYLTTELSGTINSSSWNLTLSEGNYNWTCLAEDVTGLIGYPSYGNLTYGYDNSAPTTTPIGIVKSGAAYTFGSTAMTQYVNVSFSCGDGSGIGCNATIYCNDTFNNCTPSSIYSSVIQLSGNNTYYVRYYSNDSLNHTESIQSSTIIIGTISFFNFTETSGQTLSRDHILANVSSGTDNLLNISLELFNSSGDRVNVSASVSAPFAINWSGLAAGLYFFNATAYYSDFTNLSTNTINVTIDFTAPIVNTITPANNFLTHDGRLAFVCNASDSSGIANITLMITNVSGLIDHGLNIGTGANGIIYSTKTDSNESILIVGAFTTINGTTRNRIARMLSNGTLDQNFNTGTGANNIIYALAIQQDGKILLGGDFTTYNGITENRIVRIHSNGSLDTTFNASLGPSASVLSIAVQEDGKILIGGSFITVGAYSRTYFARLNSDGSVDTGYNPVASAAVRGILIENTTNKSIIIGDFTSVGGTTRTRIARLETDGTLDTTFDIHGVGANGIVYTIAPVSDNKYLIGGAFTSVNGTAINRIARIHNNGTIDQTFNPGPGADNNIMSIAVNQNGQIYIGGDFTVYGTNFTNRVARLDADGAISKEFSNQYGTTTTVRTISIDNYNRPIIVGSFTSFNAVSKNYMVRLLADSITSATSGIYVQTQWNLTLPYGNYSWICTTSDTSGQTATADTGYSNLTIYIPQATIQLISPDANANTSNANTTFYYNASSAMNFTNCSLYLDNLPNRATNATITNITGNLTPMLLMNETLHSWYINCTDNAYIPNIWISESRFLNITPWYSFNLTFFSNITGGSPTQAVITNSSGAILYSSISNGTSYLERNLKYNLTLTTQLIFGEQRISIVNINLTNNQTIPIQVIENYTMLPPSMTNFTPIFTINDSGMIFDYATLELPTAGINVEQIMHCSAWNFTNRTCMLWEYNETTDFNATINATHIIFNASRFDSFGGGAGNTLPNLTNISLYDITGLSLTDTSNRTGRGMNMTFNITAGRTYRMEFNVTDIGLNWNIAIDDWLNFSGLNTSWLVNTSGGIWYVDGAGTTYTGGTFTNGVVNWTLSSSSRIRNGERGIFYFVLNTTNGPSKFYNTYFLVNDTSKNSGSFDHSRFNFTGKPDLMINQMTFSNAGAIEGQNITAFVNVTNLGYADSTNFTVRLNITRWNGTTFLFNESRLSDQLNLTIGQLGQVNFSWLVNPGIFQFNATVDILLNVTEYNETNNSAVLNYTLSGWQIFYGFYNYTLRLADGSERNLSEWVVTIPEGNSFYSDDDSLYNALDLRPLNDTNDFIEADIALNMTGFNDSVSKLFDSDNNGKADINTSFTIGGVVINNISIINVSSTSAFITGVMWDSADGGIQYDGTQDLVFVTKLNSSRIGAYGSYDYEVKIPSRLENLKTGADLVKRIDELT